MGLLSPFVRTAGKASFREPRWPLYLTGALAAGTFGAWALHERGKRERWKAEDAKRRENMKADLRRRGKIPR